MRRSRLLTVILLGACNAPAQYGGPIAIDEAGFGARMDVMCRMGRASAHECRRGPPPASTRDAGTRGSVTGELGAGRSAHASGTEAVAE